MKTYTTDELEEVLRLHKRWLRGDRAGIKADLRNSDLHGSDLRYSDLRGSDLRNSDLRHSDLHGSDLRYSDLRGSDLRHSDLRDSNLSNVIGFVYIGQRTDGYTFHAQYSGSEWVIKAGCRSMAVKEYRFHTMSYDCGIKRQETNDLLDFAEKRIKLIGRIE